MPQNEQNKALDKWLMTTPLVQGGFKPISDQIAESLKTEKNCKDFAERLVFEIVNKPSEFNAAQGTADFLNGLAHRQHEILDIVEKISKELRGESDNG